MGLVFCRRPPLIRSCNEHTHFADFIVASSALIFPFSQASSNCLHNISIYSFFLFGLFLRFTLRRGPYFIPSHRSGRRWGGGGQGPPMLYYCCCCCCCWSAQRSVMYTLMIIPLPHILFRKEEKSVSEFPPLPLPPQPNTLVSPHVNF